MAKAMRHVLVDAARSHRAHKHGGEVLVVPLDEGALASPAESAEIEALDGALTVLAKFDSRKAQVVEMRCFGGLSVEETAQALDVSPETVTRDWKFARAFLRKEMMHQRRI
jgi:RNA polymerase sigma factor (TIGR02999 family)